MSSKALIVGVSGQDGSYLARFLVNKGYKVFGTSRDAQISSFYNLKKLEIHEKIVTLSMAVNDFRSVLQVLSDVLPDEIYNLAGQTSVSLSFDQPVETMDSISGGTLNILEAIRFLSKPMKFYNACSSECFGSTGDICADELTPFRPCSPYAVAKATAFWLVNNYRRAYNLFACSGILFNHESPLRPNRFVTKKIVSAACGIANGTKKKVKLGNIEISRDWGWAPDYVEAMWMMLQRENPSDYIIATGETRSLKDFVCSVFRYLNLDWQEYVEIDSTLFRPSDIERSYGNPTKALHELGWQARFKMDEVVQAMVDDECNRIRKRGKNL
jgi:GDPmannose 4,6-dehydratase